MKNRKIYAYIPVIGIALALISDGVLPENRFLWVLTAFIQGISLVGIGFIIYTFILK